jgi:hypothetical protein
MDIVMTELAKLLAPYALWLAGGWALSEILGQIPSIKSNNVFQFITGLLKGIIDAIKNQATKPNA